MKELNEELLVVKDEWSIQVKFSIDKQVVHRSFVRLLALLDFWNNSNWVGTIGTNFASFIAYLLYARNEKNAQYKTHSYQVNMEKVKHKQTKSTFLYRPFIHASRLSVMKNLLSMKVAY